MILTVAESKMAALAASPQRLRAWAMLWKTASVLIDDPPPALIRVGKLGIEKLAASSKMIDKGIARR